MSPGERAPENLDQGDIVTKQQIIDAARDPRKTNIGNLGAALAAAARKEAQK